MLKSKWVWSDSCELKNDSFLVGPTVDPSGVCVVDSVKVYGKTKEAFGWPDDIDEELPTVSLPNEPRAPPVSSISTDEQQQSPQTRVSRDMSEFERAIKNIFDTLSAAFSTFSDLTVR